MSRQWWSWRWHQSTHYSTRQYSVEYKKLSRKKVVFGVGSFPFPHTSAMVENESCMAVWLLAATPLKRACMSVQEEKHTTTWSITESSSPPKLHDLHGLSLSLSLPFLFVLRKETTILIWPFGKRLVWLAVPKIQIRNPHSIQFTCHASFISLGKSKAPSSQKKKGYYHTWWLMGHDSEWS